MEVINNIILISVCFRTILVVKQCFQASGSIAYRIHQLLVYKKSEEVPRISVKWANLLTIKFSSVAQLCPTLCNPMNRSTPGLPVHHQLLEFTQTHVHQVSDAIQPSHPLSSPSPLLPIPPSIRVFSNESTVRMRWPKYWSFSFSIIPSKEIPKKFI